MKTACLIALGSNTEGEQHLEKARKELSHHFPDITFTPTCHTTPIELHNPSLFLNQVALFHTAASLCQVQTSLKEIEQRCARVPKDKVHEIIRIDIDLIQFGEVVLKPEDMQRSYIQIGLQTLSASHPQPQE